MMTKTKLMCLICAALLIFACPALAQGDDYLASLNSASITLSGDTASVDGYGVTVAGGIVTITMPGVYTITGTLDDGQLVVDCALDEKVELILAGVSIHSENSAAIYIPRSEKRTTIRTLANTQNSLSSGEITDEGIEGVIYSKGDLTLTGEGLLTVVATNTDAIVSKDDLRVKGGMLTIETPEDGIRGKDSVEIYAGVITIIAGNDGIKSTNKEDVNRGFISISGGEIYITYGDDCLQFVTRLEVTGGTISGIFVDPD